MNYLSLCAGEWRRNYDQCGEVSLLGLTLQELSLWELSLKLMVTREYRRDSQSCRHYLTGDGCK